MSLLNNMFSPALSQGVAKKGKSTSSARLSTPIKYYIVDGTPTRDQIFDLALACAVAATSTSGTLLQWKNLLATYTNILFDGIVTKLPKDQFQAVKLSQTALVSLRNQFIAIDGQTDALTDDNGTGLPAGAFANFYPQWDLPVPSKDAVGGWATYCREEHSLYAHYALIVFLAGKQINDTNRAAITTNRPRALIGKFNIEAVEILNGSMRISDEGHSMINQAWLEMSALKAECFREFSNYGDSATSLGQDIILVNINLMRFSQLTHASLVHKFLLAYPWARELSYLRQPIALYMDSLNSVSKVEPHLQPFIKIIWGDKSGVFLRKDLGPLIAVALDTEKEVHETLSAYYSDEAFASVVEAFRDERAKREKLAGKVAKTTVIEADSEDEGEEGEEIADDFEEGGESGVAGAGVQAEQMQE